MLAQSFLPAAELGIADVEQQALIKVLGMLERGDLVDVHYSTESDNGFHMGTSGHGCGTPACIGGWAAYLMEIDQSGYLDRYDITQRHRNPAIHELFWSEVAVEKPATVDEAAIALRSYLTTGNAKWHEAVADQRKHERV